MHALRSIFLSIYYHWNEYISVFIRCKSIKKELVISRGVFKPYLRKWDTKEFNALMCFKCFKIITSIAIIQFGIIWISNYFRPIIPLPLQLCLVVDHKIQCARARKNTTVCSIIIPSNKRLTLVYSIIIFILSF